MHNAHRKTDATRQTEKWWKWALLAEKIGLSRKSLCLWRRCPMLLFGACLSIESKNESESQTDYLTWKIKKKFLQCLSQFKHIKPTLFIHTRTNSAYAFLYQTHIVFVCVFMCRMLSGIHRQRMRYEHILLSMSRCLCLHTVSKKPTQCVASS